MKVQLIKPHTHAGVRYEPGQVLEVNDMEAAWMDERGIVQHHNQDASHDANLSTKRGRRRDTDRDTREENKQ
ncbi:MAG TPA: hypothetical protein VFJ01_06210 [Oleiagrimonas sp.]|nr:hypothetical protein [Oleiagrimonas sp.]